MDLFKQASIFHKLCSKLEEKNNKKLAQSQETPYNQELTDLAFDAMEFKETEGVAVDVSQVQAAGKKMYSGIVQKKPQDILDGAQSLIELTRDGGGELGQRAVDGLALAKKMFPPAPPKPVLVITPAYYQMLANVEHLAKELSSQTSADPDYLSKIKNMYAAMAGQLSDAQDYLQFTEATSITGKQSSDPNQRALAEKKQKEINSFRARLERAEKTIDSALQGFAGTERRVEGPTEKEEEESKGVL